MSLSRPTLRHALAGGFFIGLLGLFTTLQITQTPPADIRVDPQGGNTSIDTPLTIDIVVESEVNANAFSGTLLFDQTILAVDSIEYNTSIANIWVEAPWYSAGDGTIQFAGGTTEQGGFTGSGILLSVTFIPQRVGTAAIELQNAQILAHDGFGTAIALNTPVDALFSVSAIENQAQEIKRVSKQDTITVLPERSQLDLNNDGRIGAADISIFIANIFSNDMRFDFNGDGRVDWTDLRILLQARDRN